MVVRRVAWYFDKLLAMILPSPYKIIDSGWLDSHLIWGKLKLDGE